MGRDLVMGCETPSCKAKVEGAQDGARPHRPAAFSHQSEALKMCWDFGGRQCSRAKAVLLRGPRSPRSAPCLPPTRRDTGGRTAERSPVRRRTNTPVLCAALASLLRKAFEE